MDKITVSTHVATPINQAWEYWTRPEHIVRWNYASDDWHCPSAENDLKIGGVFRSTMAARDGSMQFDFAGMYDDVVLHKIISYSMPDGRQVFVMFEESDGHTIVTERFDPDSSHPVDMQRAGWQAILDNFKKYAEQN